ncbi:MAG: hypothetical protein R6U17_02480 [Thermoplasmata archaeon]
MKPVDKKTVMIAAVFGVISIILLILLKADGIFLIIILWMLVPVILKKMIDKIKSSRKPG